MSSEIKTRRVERRRSENYLKKAEEYDKTMEACFTNGQWNACILNAIHCGISSIDALTVYLLELRHAGDRHLEAIELLKRTQLDPDELDSKSMQFSFLLSIKNVAEYEDRLMDEKDAQNAMKAANRIFSWVKNELKNKK